MTQAKDCEENRIKKVIFNEFSLVLAIVGAVSGVIFWVANPQQAMELELVRLKAQIETNQTVTESLQELKNNDLNEFQLRLDRMETRQIEQLEAIARIEALLLKE